VYVVEVGAGEAPVRWDWVVGEDADDFVSAAAAAAGDVRLRLRALFDRGGLSCRTYFTCSRSPALAGSIRRCRPATVR